MFVVINDRHGGFGLSNEALENYCEVKGILDTNSFSHHFIDRCDPTLVDIVRIMGDRANDRYSRLKIVEIPDGTDYFIQEHDGMEWIAEAHRTWR